MRAIAGLTGIALAAVLCAWGVPAYAHAPTSVQVTYDPYSQTVRVQVVHGVGNPKEHYIGKVTVLINGREAIRQELARQDGPAGVTVSYRLPDAGPGDVITVEAYCNMGGDLRQNVTAPGNKPSS